MSKATDQTARRIADRGRDELVSRLRPTFEAAAREHAGLLELDGERLAELLQRAIDRADGLQWRRALAAVATEELAIGLGDALEHPTVVQAHALAQAPSYEDSLGALGDGSRARRRRRPQAAEKPARVPEPEPPTPTAQLDGGLRLKAVHLSGIANLKADESGIELRLGSAGLDIARADGDVLGRLGWSEIKALDVPPPRRLRRRRLNRAQLVIRTDLGDATFMISAMSQHELEEKLAPMVRRYRDAG